MHSSVTSDTLEQQRGIRRRWNHPGGEGGGRLVKTAAAWGCPSSADGQRPGFRVVESSQAVQKGSRLERDCFSLLVYC